MAALLLSFAVVASMAVPLAVAAGFAQRKRAAFIGGLVFLALLALDQVAVYLAFELHANVALGLHWNWFGKLFSLIWVVAFLLFGPYSFAEAGFRAPRPGTLPKGLLAVALFAVGPLIVDIWMHSDAARSVETMLYQAFMPALGEESVYRGALYAVLVRAFGERDDVGPWYKSRAIWLTALAFGLIHGWGVLHGAWAFHAGAAIFPFLFGLAAGVLRRYSGSVYLPMLLHGIVDFSFALFP